MRGSDDSETGSAFYFLPQEDVWGSGLVPSDPGYSSLLARPDSWAEGDQTRINLNADVKPELPWPILFCLIHGGHCRNRHPWFQGRQGRAQPRDPRGHPAACGHPVPARREHLPERPRGLCRAEMALNIPKLGPGCSLSTRLGGLSPFYAPFLFSLPSQVGTGQLSLSLPVRGKMIKTLWGKFSPPLLSG